MTNKKPTRNSITLEGFVRYCEANPNQRFWQALRNWSGKNFVYVSDISVSEYQVGGDLIDTFDFEGRSS